MKHKNTSLSQSQKVGIGVGITAAAAAAAGAYFLYGSTNAAKNRKTVKSWALKAKAEVLEKIEQAKEMTQVDYEAVVQQVVGAYSTLQAASKKDLKEFQEEMNSHWKKIAAKPKAAKKTAKKSVVKTAKTVAKKASK